MPFTGGERPVGEHSTAGSALVHHRTTQTCHSEERSDVGISGRQLRFRRWLSHDPAGYCEIATSAYGLLAMTNLEASRHRRNAVLVASLQGAHYPQGARRIRKAAKPPTAAQGTPLQTQSVRAVLTAACSYWRRENPAHKIGKWV